MPGPFCAIRDFEYTQDCLEYAILDVFTFDDRNFSMVMRLINMLQEEGTSQIHKQVI